MLKNTFFLIVFIVLKHLVELIPIPNGQIGNAEVECTKETIEIHFNTKDIFLGRVFVVGYANNTNCVSRATGKKTTSIKIKKNKCGVVKIKSGNPPGFFENVKVIISFHDEFITKVDRGYEISCFYMETSKTVTFPISVSPNKLQPFTEIAAMPRCKYEVLDPVTRKPVSIVSVNTKLLHKWSCESDDPNFWCMTVNTCFVDDGRGTQFTILNEQGCAIDRFLLDNLKYGPGLLQAEKEAHAFKFADRMIVNFQCSIRLDIRDGKCPTPKCPDLSKKNSKFNKRSLKEIGMNGVSKNKSHYGFTEIDVRASQINVLDPDFDFNENILELSSEYKNLSSKQIKNLCKNECISLKTLIMSLSFSVTLIILLLTVVIYLIYKSKA